MTQFKVTYLKDYKNIHSGETLIFNTLQEARNFVLQKKFWIELFIEHRDDGTMIVWEANTNRSFEPRLFCWPEGVNRDSIELLTYQE